MTVQIDFVAGSHGNFLEYMSNKFIANIPLDFSPFDNLGASHIKPSKSIRKFSTFQANHYSNLNIPLEKDVIRILIVPDDLLLLSSVCLLRAGNSNINVYSLEFDTFNKLKGGFFEDYLHRISVAYPDICLSADHPDCPRYVLRELFKFSFKDPSIDGLMKKAKELTYQSNINVFDFQFDHFYNTDKFLNKFIELGKWQGVDTVDIDQITTLHKEFLDRQIFKDHKLICDTIVESVKMRQQIKFDNLTILQEAYISAALENLYQKEMPFMQDSYFNSTQEIVYYLKYLKCLKSNRFLSKIS